MTLANYTWDNNEYYGTTWSGGGFFYNGKSDFNGWKSKTGFDAHSTYSATPPAGKWVTVRPNKYEPGRASITICNWDKSNMVDVDVSSALSVGDAYLVRDVQNFFAATPVATGTYAGGTIPIPMTGLAKGAPVGNLPVSAVPHTAPEFGTFILFKTSAGSAGVYGDANGDGAFGMADINQMVDWLLGRATPPASGTARFSVSDVNGDNNLSMADLNLMVDRLLGRITKFPVEH
jgi:hypothetical protein